MRPVVLAMRGLVAVLVIALVLAVVSPARAAGPRLDRGEAAIVRALNRVRARHHLPRLRVNRRLDRAADLHTAQILRLDRFAHGAFAARVHRFLPSRAVGETLAYIPRSRCRRRRVRQVVAMWMHSPPHRAILLSGRYRRVGVGRRRGRLGALSACVVTADFTSAR
jgi:uncharacterized protein YkwD